MNKTIFTTVTGLVAATMLTIGVTSCTQVPAPVEPDPVPVVTETIPEPVEPVEGDLDGDGKLSGWEREQLAKSAPIDYTLSDGTVAQIDPTKPLPTEIKAEVKAKSEPQAVVTRSIDADVKEAAFLDMMSRLDAQAEATGRGIVIVYPILGSRVGMLWAIAASGTKSAPYLAVKDKAEMVAKATAYADQFGHELIVFD